MGLGMPYRPTEGIPSLPVDLTEIPDEELIDLMSQFVEWANYAGGKLAMAESDEGDLEDRLLEERSRAMLRTRTGTVTEDRASADADPKVIECRREWRKAKTHRKALGSLVDALERNSALLSRELTRRVNVEPVVNRQRRWTP